MNNNYEKKYLKYKEKYLKLKNQSGSGSPLPEMSKDDFEKLALKAYQGNTQEVLYAVDQDGRLATRGSFFFNKTLLHEACQEGHVELARGLLARGASVGARNVYGHDAMYYASSGCNLTLRSCSRYFAVLTLLLDNGGDPNTRDNEGVTPLWEAAQYANLDICLFLIAKGADLMAKIEGRTALDNYGQFRDSLNPGVTPEISLSPEVLTMHRAALLSAWNWARRLPMMLFVTGCRFRPLAGKKGWIPIEGLSLEQRKRARRRSLVFSSDVLLRLIVSFL